MVYNLLNSSFLYAIEINEIKKVDGQPPIDIGNAFLESILPSSLSGPLSLLFGVALISSLSSMLIAGPSVLEIMGNDYSKLKILNKKNRYFAPYISILCLMFLSIILVQNAGFKELVEYIGVILSIFAVLVVLGVPILRNIGNNENNIYKAPFGNLISIIFCIINLWMIYYVIESDLNKLFYKCMI